MTRQPAAGDRAFDIDLFAAIGNVERLLNQHPENGPGEIDIKRLAVDGDLAAAAFHPHPRSCVLAAAGSVGAALGIELGLGRLRLGLGHAESGAEIGESGLFGHDL